MAEKKLSFNVKIEVTPEQVKQIEAVLLDAHGKDHGWDGWKDFARTIAPQAFEHYLAIRVKGITREPAPGMEGI